MSTPAGDLRTILDAQLKFEAWADAASASLGLNRSDFAMLRAVLLEGPCPAGRLAELTGLSSGAVTVSLDRLEKASLVRRTSDPEDRRKVIAMVEPARRAELEALYIGPFEGTQASWSVLSQAAAGATEALRAAGPIATEPDASGRTIFPSQGRRTAHLEIAGGSLDLLVDDSAPEALLAEANFPHALVKVTEHGGNLRISHRGRWRGGRPSGTVSLAAGVTWSIRVSGGDNTVTFSLPKALVSGVEIEGGSGRLTFLFGRTPGGELPVRVNGGASHFVFERPPGVAAEVAVGGRASSLVVDGLDLGAPYNPRWTSDDPGAVGRIRVSVRGGLNHVVLRRGASTTKS